MTIITLMIFIVIIGLILIGIANGNRNNTLNIFLKAILVIIITLIGGAITCGGNLMLDSAFPGGGGYGSRYANELFIFWIVEIGAIFILSIWFLFFRKKK